MAGFFPQPTVTGPSPTDNPRQDSAVRLPLRSTVVELLLGSLLAVVVSMVLQFAATRMSISEPSFAPEALAAVATGLIVLVLFTLLTFGQRRGPRWLRLAGTWTALAAFSTLALAIPLQNTRYYLGGSSTDNGFRMQYMTRMAENLGLVDMNYADTAPYYPAGWFWLGGRFANLLGWEGWAAYKPYAIVWVAVTSVVAFTLWSVVIRRRLALLAALATTLAGLLHGVNEPYAWPSAAWLPPVAVLTWHAMRRETPAPRWTLACIGAFVGFAAVTYTLHFGFAVLLFVTMAIVLGLLRISRGARVGDTVKRMFLRLLPVGIVSALIALLVWLPYVVATSFFLDNPRSAALHYLPEEGAFLPMPMTEGDALGVLCLAGLVWLLIRCHRNEIAAAMLTTVVAVYTWFVLSTVALVAKTTLLAFRLTVILEVVLVVAGVLGLLELVGYLRNRIDARHAAQLTLVTAALGLVGTITITQGAIGTAMQPAVKQAYTDYYPTGDTARGEQDPEKAGAWTDELIATISDLSGREPQENIVISTEYKIMSFRPYWGYQQETPHYANPLGEYADRAERITNWSKASSSADLVRMLNNDPYGAPNVFVLRLPEGTDGQGQDSQSPGQAEGAQDPAAPQPDDEAAGKLALQLKGDSFPQQPNVRDYDVYFDPTVFESPEFETRDVGPYRVVVRR